MMATLILWAVKWSLQMTLSSMRAKTLTSNPRKTALTKAKIKRAKAGEVRRFQIQNALMATWQTKTRRIMKVLAKNAAKWAV